MKLLPSHMFTVILIAILTAITLFISSICPASETSAPTETPAELQRYEFEGIEMAVPIRIVLYAPNREIAERASQAALERFHDLNGCLSDYDENSEIRRFCDATLPGEWVRVSDDLWTVLRLAVHHAELSDGAFDPTVGQVVRLWRRARKGHRLPSERQIREMLATVGYENILFDETNQAIALSKNGAKNHVRIDLGGIAKGYAIDEAIAVMKYLGVSRVLVDAGGDIGLGDAPPEKPEGWTIAVTPAKKGEKSTDFWTLKNCGVANSGDMYQFVEIDGKRYSHIVNPATGLGLTNRLMVSVIAPTAADADALASAVSVLGPQKGLALIQTLNGTEAQILEIVQISNSSNSNNNNTEKILKYGR